MKEITDKWIDNMIFHVYHEQLCDSDLFFCLLLRIFKPMTKSFNTMIIVCQIIWIDRESSKVINIWRNSIMIQGFILENDERRNWHFIDVNTFNDWNPFLSFRYWLLLRFQALSMITCIAATSSSAVLFMFIFVSRTLYYEIINI